MGLSLSTHHYTIRSFVNLKILIRATLNDTPLIIGLKRWFQFMSDTRFLRQTKYQNINRNFANHSRHISHFSALCLDAQYVQTLIFSPNRAKDTTSVCCSRGRRSKRSCRPQTNKGASYKWRGCI